LDLILFKLQNCVELAGVDNKNIQTTYLPSAGTNKKVNHTSLIAIRRPLAGTNKKVNQVSLPTTSRPLAGANKKVKNDTKIILFGNKKKEICYNY
jgi:hypothetical protein